MNITVGILVDFMGCLDMTPEEEMKYIEDEFTDNLGNYTFTFLRNIRPHDLGNQSLDIYVFDFGGLLPGCDGLLNSMYGSLLTQIEEKPSVLFVLWGALSRPYYEDELSYRFEEEKEFPNVISRFGEEDIFTEIEEWIRGKSKEKQNENPRP